MIILWYNIFFIFLLKRLVNFITKQNFLNLKEDLILDKEGEIRVSMLFLKSFF